ncbi:MAG: ZIP family metal transporter [Flavobacteriales bacterium]|nr:ZIP family metal transporter [Flavobacteriales bacterium]
MQLTVIIGLLFSVVLGSGIVLSLRPKPAVIKMMLAFSGAYLLSVCVLELIPEIYFSLEERSGLFILAGFLIQLVLSYFSEGVEHGHMHTGHRTFTAPVLFSLVIHSFAEGMALGGDITHTDFGKALFAGILLHKVPIAIVVTSVLVSDNVKTPRMLGVLILFALSAPAGMWLSGLGFGDDLSEAIWVPILLAVVAGMLLHISTIILFESSHDHRFNAMKLLIILLGVAVALGVYFRL